MPKLIVRDMERTLLLDLAPEERVVLGRSHGCELPVTAVRASRRHAEIGPLEASVSLAQTVAADEVEGAHQVVDLDSTNGTLLNGAPFQGAAPLRDGDVVDVGGCLVTYHSTP